MTSLAVRSPTAVQALTGDDVVPVRVDRPAGLLPAVVACLAAAVLAAGLVVLRPTDGVPLGAAVLVGGLVLVGSVVLLDRLPQIAPWVAVLLFSSSAELKLRVSPLIGATKDGYVILLVGVALAHALRRPSAVRRLRSLAFAGAALAVLVGLYVVNPGGAHGVSWIAGCRLLLEVLALLLVGLVLAPEKALRHLVAAMTVLLPIEAVLAWTQQMAGLQSLVYQWGYAYGAQVRISSGGSLRTSGTFEDPFQLAALGVLGLALALFVASRWQAALLVPAAIAILGATSVRTALIQTGVLVVVWAVRRGWWRPAAALAAVAVVAGVLTLATTTSVVHPGAPEEPLLFSLNGRSTAWTQAVDGWESLVAGNGVGARGTGSTSTGSVGAAPAYSPGAAPIAAYAGSSAFLDSSYAQIQSDVGIVGTAALLTALGALGVCVVRGCRISGDGAPWAAGGVLLVSLVDWVGRSSLASYTTGFLTLYTLGVLLGAGSIRQDFR